MNERSHGTRPAELHARWMAWCKDRFGILLVLLFIDYIALMALPQHRWGVGVGIITVAITVVFGLDASVAPRRIRVLAWVMLGAIATVTVIYMFTGIQDLRGPLAIAFGLVLVLTPLMILKRLLGHARVDAATLLAALCVYILIGLVFAEMFIGVAHNLNRPEFLAQGPYPHPPSDYVYLSYVTLTTLGFGDLTPKSEVARTLVVGEALIGQIFLVTAVARVVSLYGQRQAPEPEEGSDEQTTEESSI